MTRSIFASLLSAFISSIVENWVRAHAWKFYLHSRTQLTQKLLLQLILH